VNGFQSPFPSGPLPFGQGSQRLHDGMRFYGERGGFEHHGGHQWLGFLFLALLLVLLALLIGSVVRGIRSRRTAAEAAATAGPPGDDALSVLRLRYARGEIGRDDFLRAHEDLGGGSGAAVSL